MNVSSPDVGREFLLIAPLYPPTGGSGVQRTVKLAKYIRQFGWQPRVVTMRGLPYRGHPTDDTLLLEVMDVPVTRVRHFDIRKTTGLFHRLGFHEVGDKLLWTLPVDGYIGWIPTAVRACRRLLKTRPIRLLYTSSAPYSAHLVGLILKREFDLPWVADFRDPWTTNDLLPQYDRRSLLSRWKTWIDEQFEQRVLAEADRVVVVVNAHRQALIDRFQIQPDKVCIIPNGYDEQDFAEIPYPLSPYPDCFRIGYTGSFYTDYNPASFLEMFRRFLLRCPTPDLVRFRIVGRGSRWLLDNRAAYEDIWNHIELIDHLEHRELMKRMREFTVLYLQFYGDWTMTTKLFEYLRTGLPVIGVASELGTPMEQLIRDARAGSLVLDSQVEQGADRLMALFQQWKTGIWDLNPNIEAIKPYERHVMAECFSHLFNQLT